MERENVEEGILLKGDRGKILELKKMVPKIL